MKKVIRKLKQRSGETLAEVLIALLVSCLAIAMLTTMISSSIKVMDKSDAKMKSYYEASNAINERQDGDEDDDDYVRLVIDGGTVHMRAEDRNPSNTHQGYIHVDYYINEESSGTPVITYKEAADE